MNNRSNRLSKFLLISLFVVFVWSLIKPVDLFTWVLEALPVIIAVPFLMITYKKFRLTDTSYILIWVHAIILLIGAHYTYAKVPAFNWIRDTFELSRNHYDRLGHFAQGFVPAILAREILLRTSTLQKGKWLFWIVVCITLAISASYELIEWIVAVVTGTAAEAFLGTQGDIWDTQKDMALAFFGAIVALLTLSRMHNKELEKVMP